MQLAVLAADERLLQPVRVLDEVVGELSLDAEGALVGRAVHGGLDADDRVALGQDVDRAADAAVGADGAGLLDLAGQSSRAQRLLVAEGAGRAGLDALAAEGAVRVLEVLRTRW